MQAITKNIEGQFSDKEVTAWGGMRMFKEFYDRTGMREELRRMAGAEELPYKIVISRAASEISDGIFSSFSL